MNTNKKRTNNLGHTERSTHAEGMVGLDTLGALTVKDIKTGVTFNVGSGFNAAQRAAIWAEQSSFVGKVIKYKHFPIGVKDKPRFPTFLGFRNKDDML
jgi:DNA ligase-1